MRMLRCSGAPCGTPSGTSSVGLRPTCGPSGTSSVGLRPTCGRSSGTVESRGSLRWRAGSAAIPSARTGGLRRADGGVHRVEPGVGVGVVEAVGRPYVLGRPAADLRAFRPEPLSLAGLVERGYAGSAVGPCGHVLGLAVGRAVRPRSACGRRVRGCSSGIVHVAGLVERGVPARRWAVRYVLGRPWAACGTSSVGLPPTCGRSSGTVESRGWLRWRAGSAAIPSARTGGLRRGR